MTAPLTPQPREDQTIGARDDTRWSSSPGRALASLVWRTESWASANAVLAACLVVGLAVLGATVWAAGEVYESVQAHDGLAALDRPVLTWVETIRTPGLDSAIAFFSNTGGPILQPIITAVLVLLVAWRWRSWTPIVLPVAAEAGALVLTLLGKQLTGRARPPLAESIPPYEYSPSFPSGHTLNATVIAGVLCYLMLHVSRTRAARVAWVTVAAAYAAAMGLSRVYLGHHWLTDVIAGWLLGLAWLAVVVVLHRLWLTARERHGRTRWSAMIAPPPDASPAAPIPPAPSAPPA